jgi:hypothetical protein
MPSIWLLSDEQILAKQRMEEEVAAKIEQEGKPIEKSSGLAEALMDWRVWWLGVAHHLMLVSMSFSIFFPTLSATMGYNATTSLLLCAPPWILGTATTVVVARSVFTSQILWKIDDTELRHSNVIGDRFWHIVGPLLVGIAGFILAMSTMNTAVQYLSLYKPSSLCDSTGLYVPYRFFMAQTTVAYVVSLTCVMNTF